MATPLYVMKRRQLKLQIKDLYRHRLNVITVIKDPIIGYPQKLALAQIIGVYPLAPVGEPDSDKIFVNVYFPLTNNRVKLPLDRLVPVTSATPIDVRAWVMGKTTLYPGYCTQIESRLP